MQRTPPIFPPGPPLHGRIVPVLPLFLSLLLIAACDSRQSAEPVPPSTPPESATPDVPTTPAPSLPPTPAPDAPTPEADGRGKPAAGQHAEPPPGKNSWLQLPQTLSDRAEQRSAQHFG